ncbi:pectate lyase [Caulobacter sp.]|uniref:pectate lyase n=1 Tax=Caulobacter sp. TaxID=78 RepID=UPI001B1B67A8|nr:pectate lyase [Caulobacter sp.]MBO9545917.1 pectate lyase [Caulobacter sp.]
MFSRRTLLGSVAALPFLGSAAEAATGPAPAEVKATMARATRFMTDKVAVHGGYVWSYLPDLSRRWGEMEAYPSMIWTQAPGTPEMGQIFLDAYHAAGDEAYYKAAQQSADALIAGQHPSGGWNYIIDFAGEASLKRWYETIGTNGWRLEEFQHYYGNATFDDHVTVECGRFLLRLHLEKGDPKYRAAVDKAVDFVLKSQYPNGGWPQRWPRMGEFSKQGRPDYTGFITMNDEVAEENIDFLLLVLQQLKDERVREPVKRGMELIIALQQPQPTPGWAMQYSLDLKPATGRTYEPVSITPHGTAAAVMQLIAYYQQTGERKYLARVPEALDWLASVEIPADKRGPDGRNFYRNYDPSTGKLLGGHRSGSNSQNGKFWADFNTEGTKAEKYINVASLRARYERVATMSPEEATKNSTLMGRGPSLFPPYIVSHVGGSDLNVTVGDGKRLAAVNELVSGLNAEGYWPVELRTTSHPYQGPGPDKPPAGFVDVGQVGDAWDTSPFTLPSGPMGISTGAYINNMARLITYLRTQKA